jgi:hypothetical protein
MIYQIFGIIVAFFGIAISVFVGKVVVEMWKEGDKGIAILMSYFIIMGIGIFIVGVVLMTGIVK